MSKIKTVLQFEKIIKNVPTERTYTEVEMKEAFDAGYQQSDSDSYGQFFQDNTANFKEFIESLNT